MARANGVTCRECGCLNFSSEHEVCDKCRSNSPTFRPTARRSSNSHGSVSASNSRRNENAHSNGKKRRYDATPNASNKQSDTPPKKHPDVIDLISDDDEDVVVQKVVHKPKERHDLFQSRVFPTMAFYANDFPTIEEGTMMRKKMVDKDLAHSQSTVRRATTLRTPPAASQPIPQVQDKTEPTPPIKEKEIVAKTTQNEIQADATSVDRQKQSEVEDSEVGPMFQSRVFDSVEFHAADFATVFDGLAVARRSHPPQPKSSAASSSIGAISTMGHAAMARGSLGVKSTEVTGPAKEATARSSIASAPSIAVTTSEAKAKVTTGTEPAVQEATTAAPETMAKRSQTNAHDNANVLVPKKKQQIGEEHRNTKPVHNGMNTSSDADTVEFVKVNAAPHEVIIVDPPALGYCNPEFLAFMRECGGDDGEEENDPEEVSRSQLKLLHVVDLTNLSDSEDSDAEPQIPTPRVGPKQQSISASGQGSTTVGQTAAAAPINVPGKGTWHVPTLHSERKRTQPVKVMCELCEEKGIPSRLTRCPTCTKYYHKKCAKENGDENICWNCELGSLIDDSELDAEHAKHESEYLAYLKAIRRSPSPDDGKGEEEVDENNENKNQEDEEGASEEDVEMASPAEGSDENNAFSEGSNIHGKIWKDFIGGATADIDATYHEVTNRITKELRDEGTRHVYSRGFVSREEFDAQMAEVEEYYINEEARLQQLEREKALEAKKAIEARKAQETADQVPNGKHPASVPTPVVQNDSNTIRLAANAAPPSSTIVTKPPPANAINAPNSAPNAPATVATIPVATPVPVQPITSQSAAPPVVPVSGFLSTQTAAVAAVFRAAFSKTSQPPSDPQ